MDFDYRNTFNCISWIVLYLIVPKITTTEDNWYTYTDPLNKLDHREYQIKVQ